MGDFFLSPRYVICQLITDWMSVGFFLTQDSRPILISAIEDCVYTFLWLTPVACPLNSTQQDECRVSNPATGRTFTRPRGSEFKAWFS